MICPQEWNVFDLGRKNNENAVFTLFSPPPNGNKELPKLTICFVHLSETACRFVGSQSQIWPQVPPELTCVSEGGGLGRCPETSLHWKTKISFWRRQGPLLPELMLSGPSFCRQELTYFLDLLRIRHCRGDPSRQKVAFATHREGGGRLKLELAAAGGRSLSPSFYLDWSWCIFVWTCVIRSFVQRQEVFCVCCA